MKPIDDTTGQLRLFWIEDKHKPGFYVVPNFIVVAWNGKNIFATPNQV